MNELKERRYLRAREVAERLGIGITSIYRLIQSGNFITPLKFGRSTRFDIEAVDAWAADQAQNASN